MKKIIFSTPFLFLLLISCGKEGPGGKAFIDGLVKHNNIPIPRAVVYIKYGAKQSPGANITYYDVNVTADAKGHYQFADLKAGNYYLFSVGFDTTIVQTVSGGIPVVLKTKSSTVTLDIPVTQ